MEKAMVERVCMLAGKIMLVSGAETYRVEDTMNRIANSFGAPNAQSYATPTAINFAIDADSEAKMLRIRKRSTADLSKIAEVNSISRKIAAGEIDLGRAFLLLQEVEKGKLYPAWLQILASAIVSGCFAIMFGGRWEDFLPAVIAGGIGFAGMLSFERFVDIRFLAEFLGAFLIGISSLLFIHYGFGTSLDLVIIGAVMPLVPGLLITNAIRDLMAGHLVAGVSKGVEASLTAVAIGAGIAAIFTFM
ncbi:threonine/serine exporter [Bacilli bacterium]|nr:membrane protein [Bacilli bacterium VT-13-104]PZD83355.1 threonine/serine exporter [Bacilli bacterium]PZD84488.1 threonine/serine exporter [Bacilli bacterium]PZD86759.1 threonine/serine exporter [Bacilli bacterium]RCO04858.1 threonine/serine exporter [Bacilli bacterium]